MASTGRRASGRGVRRAQSRRPAPRRSARGATRLADLLARLGRTPPRRAAPRRAAPRRAAVPASTGAADTFRPDVEGLRAVAVLLVVADHVLGWPRGGYVGVDVFFTVSGFLITGLLLREHGRTGRLSLREFYARRARRLLPAAVLVLACTNLLSWLLLNGERAGQVLRDSVWALGFLANERFAAIGTDYFDETRPASPVQHYWSLSVEEQFYLLWPALLLLALWLGRRRLPVVAGVLGAVTAASFAWSLAQTTSAPTAAYFASPTRAWELGAGALVAVAVQAGVQRRVPARVGLVLSVVGLAGIGAAAVLLTPATPFPGTAALLPVLATAGLLLGGEAGAADRNRLLTSAPARYVGRISYSLYLWHWPVLVLAVAVLPSPLHVVFPLVAGFSLAALTHELVEEPVRRSRWLSARARPDAPRPVRARQPRRVVAVASVVALLGGGFALPAVALRSDGPPPAPTATEALPPAPTAADITASLAPASWPVLDPPLDGIGSAGAPEWIVDGCDNVNPDNAARCVYGPADATRTAALVGDSMAISWLPALREVLEPRGWRIAVLTRNQCPAVDVLLYRDRPEVPYVECAQHREWVLDQVAELEPELVLVSSAETMVDKQVEQPQGDLRYSRWADGLTRELRDLEQRTERVVVLGAPPRAGNLQECVTRLSSPGDCTSALREHWAAVRTAEQTAARRAGAEHVDPEPWFCAGGRCPAVIGSTPVYTDGRHLTSAYARRLAPHLARALEDALET